ncbi:Uncharacterised protein [Mycobacterium tuberculosis]|nr:Uncharacterised protein [Mycobacterium tuberculosis]CNY54810.1 Uncharacterised protein [Mycobacterium tuberculosis]
MPRTASSRSADGATMAALLPPNSSSTRPKRRATRGPTCWPIRTEPVADNNATRGSSTSCAPRSAPPNSRPPTAAGAPTSAAARLSSAWQASAVNGVSSEGFHTTVSPQTSATAVFHAQTATGKLNAVITPTTPSGCQVSRSRCPARSDAMVRP